MDPLSTLFFPDTSPAKQTLRTLLLVFEKVSYYNPSEETPPASSGDTSAGQELADAYTPVPLGDNLPRFNQLLTELKGHEGEFYSGFLSSMSSSTLTDRDEATVWSLTSLLSKNTETHHVNTEKEPHEEVWRAVLLLKLAEILTREEEEIRNGLAAIEQKRASLLKNLRGEEGEGGQHLLIPAIESSVPLSPPVSWARLTRAWGQLYLKDAQAANLPLSTDRIEAADLMIETYEKVFKKEPPRLCTLTLPDLTSLSDREYIEKRQSFKNSVQEPRERFTDILKKIMHGEEDANSLTAQIATLKETAADWAEHARVFAPTETQCRHLDVYLFEGISMHEIIGQLVVADQRGTPPAIHGQHGVMALLRA